MCRNACVHMECQYEAEPWSVRNGEEGFEGKNKGHPSVGGREKQVATSVRCQAIGVMAI